MGNLAAWLVSLAWPIVKKVMVAMGIGYATYEGLSLIGDQIRNQIITHWGQVGGVLMQILSLGGFPAFLGIVLGAFAAKLAMMTLTRITKIV